MIHQLPSMVARALNRWVLGLHRPFPLTETAPFCLHCRSEWPCKEFIEVSERLKD